MVPGRGQPQIQQRAGVFTLYASNGHVGDLRVWPANIDLTETGDSADPNDQFWFSCRAFPVIKWPKSHDPGSRTFSIMGKVGNNKKCDFVADSPMAVAEVQAAIKQACPGKL